MQVQEVLGVLGSGRFGNQTCILPGTILPIRLFEGNNRETYHELGSPIQGLLAAVQVSGFTFPITVCRLLQDAAPRAYHCQLQCLCPMSMQHGLNTLSDGHDA